MKKLSITAEQLAAAQPADAPFLAAYVQHKTTRAAAAALGCSKSRIQRAISRAVAGAEKQEDAAADTLQAARSALVGLLEYVPREPPAPAPRDMLEGLATVYTITDAHVGAYAAESETGEPWDLPTAERVLCDAVAQLTTQTPAAGTAVLAILGDFLHADGLTPTTSRGKVVLDVAGRFHESVGAGVRILRHAVAALLRHHAHVHVVIAEGNHDAAGAVWLREMFAALYEQEPRVTVDTSPASFHVYKHGRVLLAFTHGHTIAREKMPQVLAADPRTRSLWGATDTTYIHAGHYHHAEILELPGAIVEQHPTISARDAYAARAGLTSRRRMTAITYDTRGEISRATVYPQTTCTV